jgi:U3 small nucleolar RNA-associated protein 18
LTVFSNWPTSQTPLGQVSALAFSRGSEYLAIGNHKGNVLLYSIEHFARRR